MGVTKGRSAWVVRWEWAGDHAKVDQPVAAILSPQLGPETVRRLVEVLYAADQYSPVEMLEASRPGGHNPYRAAFGTCPAIQEDGTTSYPAWQGEVICGHNPHLVARKARVQVPADANGSVTFEDAPRPTPDMRGWKPAGGLEL